MGDPDHTNPQLSIVVMAYNEAANLEAVIREVMAALDGHDLGYEILIVDDGSDDGTGEVADRLGRELPPVRVLRHQRNLGLGEVYRTGFAGARGQAVTIIPADGQFPASFIPEFWGRLDGADMVLGYLFNRERPLAGRILSAVEKVLYRILFGRLPAFQGVFMFRRRLLDDLKPRSSGRGWAIVLELIIRAQRAGCRLVSVPTELRPRLSGTSKVNNLRTIWINLKQALLLRRIL